MRDAIAGEESAIKQYEAKVDATDNANAKEILKNIADEVKVHIVISGHMRILRFKEKK